jgi:CRP-like cAMP-binding protein
MSDSLSSPFWGNFLHRLQTDQEALPRWLAAHPLLKGLGERDIRHFAALLHCRKYEDGEAIFRQGDIGSGFFLIRSGAVDIVAEDTKHRSIPMAHLPEGSLVGEMAIFDNSVRSASAYAVEETVLYGLFEGDLDKLQASRPALAAILLRNLGVAVTLRLKVTNERLLEHEIAKRTQTTEQE